MPVNDPSHVLTKKEMTDLAVSAIAAMQEAELATEIDALCDRVFRLQAERLFDSLPDGNGSYALSYKPMIELLLFYIRDAARSDKPSVEEKKLTVNWTLGIAGF